MYIGSLCIWCEDGLAGRIRGHDKVPGAGTPPGTSTVLPPLRLAARRLLPHTGFAPQIDDGSCALGAAETAQVDGTALGG